MFYKDTLTTH